MPEDPTETRRDRRIKRQQLQIMDAAAILFAEKGYTATTTKDIALAADIGESTLYGYFPGKRDILIAILTEQVEILDSFIIQIDQFEDRADFIDISDKVLDVILSKSVYTRALIGEAWVNDEILNKYVIARLRNVSNLLQNFIEEKIKSGLFRSMDPALGARVLISAFVGAILPILRGVAPVPNPEQRRAMATTIVDLIMDGMVLKK